MSETICFGIGCFHFGSSRATPFSFKGDLYIQQLRQTLEACPSVANVKIAGPTDLMDYSQLVEDPPEQIGYGRNYFPSAILDGLNIEFSIHIPFRVQEDLIATPVSRLETFTEDFLVIINYGYHNPVAFIVPIEPQKEDSRGSQAVHIVREFLSRELKPNYTIRFEVLGPSPFHADCELAPDPSRGLGESPTPALLQSKEIPQDGYNQVLLIFDPAPFDSLDEAYRALFIELTDELGLYYEVVQIRNEKMRRWMEIGALTEQLVTLQAATGPRAVVRRIFRSPGLVTRAYIALAQDEGETVIAKSTIARNHSEQYAEPNASCFRRQLDEEIAKDFVAPTDASLRIVELAEKRNAKRVDVMVLLTSSLLGGAIGSLITMLVSN